MTALRLKHRIAATIFVLQSILVLVVVGTLTRMTVEHFRAQAALTETLQIEHLAKQARSSLLTEDYAELQIILEELVGHANIEMLAIVDTYGRVVASTVPQLIGERFDRVADGILTSTRARQLAVDGYGQTLGVVVARFTDAPMRAAIGDALRRALLVGVVGILVSAIVAWSLGRWLAVRLDDLARATTEVMRGQPFVAAGAAGGSPEVQELSCAIATMVDRLQEHSRALKRANDRLVLPTEAMAQGFALWDSSDRLVLSNSRLADVLGVHASALIPGISFARYAALLQRAHGAHLDRAALIDAHASLTKVGRCICDLTLAHDRVVQVEASVTGDGGIVALYTDVTTQRRDALERERNERRLQLVMRSVLDGLLVLDRSATVLHANPAAERMLGFTEAAAGAIDLATVLHTEPAWRPLFAATDGSPLEVEGEARRLDGRTFPIDLAIVRAGDEEPDLFIASIRDITVRKRADAELRLAASQDRLTGVANRHEGHARLAAAIAAATSQDTQVAVVFLDLDGFKLINDTHGHAAGDAMLVEVARRLECVVSDAGGLCRLGGDEFLLLLPAVVESGAAVRLAETALAALREPICVAGLEFTIAASAGIASFPDHADDQTELLKAADIALYAAKRSGGNRWRMFRRSMVARTRHRLAMSRQLARALERDELRLAYQPQYALGDGRLVGFEALLRWTSPVLGSVPPDQFVPIAEETGLIREIGYWTCKRAAADLPRLTAGRDRSLRVAVNVSPAQLADVDFARKAVDTLGERRTQIALELTERVLMDERGRTKRQLGALREAGLPLVLDDFGTGYSSLNHLRHFPISEIKIDRSFVADIIGDPSDAQLVRALIALCADLDIAATAEGIETTDQLEWLREAGCAWGQGYLFAFPLSVADAARVPSVAQAVPVSGIPATA